MTDSSPSTSEPSTSTAPSSSYWKFWTWRWRGTAPTTSSASEIGKQSLRATPQPTEPQIVSTSAEANSHTAPESISFTSNATLQGWEAGWERLKAIYTSPVAMERDVIERVGRMTFFAGFLMGGAGGYAQAQQTYDLNNQGRKYLSPSDAAKRRIDYAIVRFAKAGFSMGFKCALISGSIIALTTHVSAYRARFHPLYLPAMSGALAVTLHTVGSVFTFPLGVVGAAKAAGLGITSGLTLAAVVQLYALSVDKSGNDAYWHFKREYERDLTTSADFDSRVKELMKSENILWRQTAARKVRQMDEESQNKHEF